MLSIAVKLDGIERRKRSTGLLHIAAACFLLAKAVDFIGYHHYKNIISTVPIFLVVLISLVYGFFKKLLDPSAKNNKWVRMLQVCAFTVLAINFVNVGRQWEVILLFTWAIICLFLLFTERKVFHDASMVFKKEGILIPGYFKNHRIFWTNIKEVVARPDFITIFQSNEKFLQYEVLKNIDPKTIDKINQFCQTQLLETSKNLSN